MSRFSGKCDLYDTIYTLSNKQELEAFEEFKKRTNGTIYQAIETVLSKYNIAQEVKTNPQLTYEQIEVKVPDKRRKDGYRIEYKYKITYYGKTYNSFDEVNKERYFAVKHIKFDTIIDLCKYYPYIVAVMCSNPESTYVQIATKSEIDSWYEKGLYWGTEHFLLQHYENELTQEYIRLAKSYY